MAQDNKLLGEFNLEGIPPSPRGVPQIEVTFDIDVNGIAHVSARDKVSGKEQRVTIQASGGLSNQDIDKMIKEAEQYAHEDEGRKQVIDLRNQADALLHTTEKSLKEYGSHLSDDDRQAVDQAMQALREVKDSKEFETIKSKINDLNQASVKIGEAMYKNQQANAASAESPKPGDDNVMEADYQDLNKNNTE